MKKAFLKISQDSQENPCVVVSFNKITGLEVCNFIRKETPTQVFSCEYCEIFKNIDFEEHQQTAVFSGLTWTPAKIKDESFYKNS